MSERLTDERLAYLLDLDHPISHEEVCSLVSEVRASRAASPGEATDPRDVLREAIEDCELLRHALARGGNVFAELGQLQVRLRAALASLPASPPPGNNVVCGNHWHGLSGEPVDGSTGCPWCRVAELQAEIAKMEAPAPSPVAAPRDADPTDEEIAEWERRSDAATPGPWKETEPDDNALAAVAGPPATSGGHDVPTPVLLDAYWNRADAVLALTARDAIPRLVRALRRARRTP
jgi:hypothetical protein